MKKQIEEMANDLRKSEHWYFDDTDCDFELNRKKTAENLYNAGYRKQSEGEWVLHKPRMKNRNATYKCSNCGKLCSSYYNDVGEWKCCPHCFAKMKGGE